MDLDGGAGMMDGSMGRELIASEDCAVVEPYVGMEFDSEDAAKKFYDEYAGRVGFIMRIDQCRRSEVDKRILSRRLSCNKQGFYVKMKNASGPGRKLRPSTREGCKAMMLVKDNKDRRLQELTMELEHQDQLCEQYRDQLIKFLKNVEEQTELLSTKIEVVVSSLREFETEMQKSSHH
ncbi:protein FAR1-RELATED SEQUENCE 7-like isoform X3 [Malania oleifera]|uniref:protein FAR1-RELATED SEQUENCE 7-like isoform X3 n=1 Tax=Malania oleifera TaxID=397392 RepID=UPI0025AE169D|nr:protein FAR1-RELATED SEQUENCE 7-like isoform X3 [Malania oleifera]